MKRKIREKKHRLPLEYYRGKIICAFTLCVKNRVEYFKDEKIVFKALDILKEDIRYHHCIAIAYCFMPDHVHLVLMGTEDDSDLWKCAGRFHQRTGFYLKQIEKNFKWQKDFYDHIVRKDEDAVAQVRYIFENPVRKGLVSYWEDYPYKGSLGIDLNDVLEGCLLK
ncbi:transposase [bacterium]|nr:transposase [bacterium]